MKTVNIKGKEYVMVNEKIAYFRANFKGHSLESEIVDLQSDSITIKATIKNSEGVVIATGHAREVQSDGYINKASYVENCETSAWGRALACSGIGLDVSIASAEEVEGAIKQQDQIKQNEKASKELSADDKASNLKVVELLKKELPKLGKRLDDYGWHKFERNDVFTEHVKDKLCSYITERLDPKYMIARDGAYSELTEMINVIKEKAPNND